MQVPAKLYEYLRVGRPLLALVGDGAVKELLEETGAGVPLRSRDTELVALALKHYYETRQVPKDSTGPVNPCILEYSRESLTALLARELNALVASTRAH
jgi:hypothetical protein